MKNFIIPLVTAVVVVSIVFAGCVGAPPAPPVTPPAPPVTPPAPPVTPPAPVTVADLPEYQDLIAQGLIRSDYVINPWEGLAVKPDGTPYRIASTFIFMGIDVLVNWDGYLRSLVERAGGEFSNYDAEFKVENQIAWMEDIASLKTADAVILHPAQETMVIPAAELCVNAGIPVTVWDTLVPSNKMSGNVYHDFDGPEGCVLMGEWIVDYAERTGEQINIYDPWSSHAVQHCVDRQVGFKRAVEDHPLITMLEAGDTGASNDVCADWVMDAFTTHPELNALFFDGGGSEGGIEGLRAIDRLKPMGDPDHVILMINDMNRNTLKAMDDGYLDLLTSHSHMHMIDVPVKLIFTKLILGQPVPWNVPLPMVMVTTDNWTELMLWGMTPVWPWLPEEQWDLWPVLDTSEIGLETPTKDMIGTGYNPTAGFKEPSWP